MEATSNLLHQMQDWDSELLSSITSSATDFLVSYLAYLCLGFQICKEGTTMNYPMVRWEDEGKGYKN